MSTHSRQYDPVSEIIDNRTLTEFNTHERMRHPPREPSAWGFILKTAVVLLAAGILATFWNAIR